MARRKDIERHLTEDELDRRINQTDDPELLRRLIFVKTSITTTRSVGPPIASPDRNPQVDDGPSGGTMVASRDSRRRGATAVRRNSTMTTGNDFASFSRQASRGRHGKSDVSLKMSLTFRTIRIIFMNSFCRSTLITRNGDQNSPTVLKTPTTISTNGRTTPSTNPTAKIGPLTVVLTWIVDAACSQPTDNCKR